MLSITEHRRTRGLYGVPGRVRQTSSMLEVAECHTVASQLSKKITI